MPSVRSGKAEIYYECAGSGPALVFAHGSGGYGASWWQQVPHFAEHFRVVSFDHRCFGRSRCAPDDFDPARFADDLIAVLDACEIERAALVGQSMGGWSVLPAARAHPERTSALVLACTPGGIFTREIAKAAAESAGEKLDDDFLRGGMTFAPDYAAREPEMAWLYDQISALNVGFSPELVARLFDKATRIAPEALASFDIPTLALLGEHDALFPPPALRSAVEHIPGVEIREVAGAGHSIYWEMADAFNEIVGEFLAKHVGG